MIPRFWQGLAYSCLGLLLLAPSMVVADDDLGVTMRMVTDDADLTESVVREIELREPVALERRGSGEGKTADTPHEAPGLDKAREARERGREAAEQAREAHERNRERPEHPERPDVSERPEKPERP